MQAASAGQVAVGFVSLGGHLNPLATADGAARQMASIGLTPLAQPMSTGGTAADLLNLAGVGASVICVTSALGKRILRKKNHIALGATKKQKGSAPGGKKTARPPPPPAWELGNQIGALPPIGGFDPLDLCDGEEGKFKRLRGAELKHGRVAMMAAVGFVGQHFLRFPGFESVPNKGWVVGTPPASYGWSALIVFCGVVELFVWTQEMGKEPGNFGDPLGLNMYTTDMRNKEVSNGRFAMLAVIGIIAAQGVSGLDAVEQLQAMLPAV